MEFSFNSDQAMIAEAAATFLSAQSNSAAVRRAMATEIGYEESFWSAITQELGWQLTHIPEQYDGLGLGYVELAILFEQMGTHLACAPFFSTIALGSNALLLAGSSEQKEKWLPKISAGEVRIAFAYSGQGRIWGEHAVQATYIKASNGYELNGQYHYVIDGHSCDLLVLAAKGKDGLKLFLIDTHSQALPDNLQCDWTPSVDQTRKLAKVQAKKLLVPNHNVLNGDVGTLENILALACICLAAEQMGVAQASLEQTIAYIKERQQFGRAVGSFQAMKHKAADMLNKVEAARSAVFYAACVADEFVAGQPLGGELQEAASIAKAYCCDAAYFNSGCAIQMHGGVGFTWEYDIHLYFKRAKAGQVSFGDTAYHKERIAVDLLGELDLGRVKK